MEASRLLLLLLGTVFCFFVFPSGGLGCGVTTHNVIGHRALAFFKAVGEFKHPGSSAPVLSTVDFGDVARRNQDAFQAGCAFPDFGYACPLKDAGYPQLPNASEGAHWEPFARALGKYVRVELPAPGPSGWPHNSYPEKVISFFMGVLSHQTADILWHDLQIVWFKTQQGFLQVLGEADYNAHGDTYTGVAHSEGDAGGEFMCAYEIPLDFVQASWYLPSDAALWAYYELGFTKKQLPRDVLESCFGLMYAEVQAISRLASELLYPDFAEKSPFLVEQFQEEFLGGVDDMAAWTGRCWTEGLELLQNSTYEPPGQVCLVSSRWSWGGGNKVNSSRESSALHQRAAIPEDTFRQFFPVAARDKLGTRFSRASAGAGVSASVSGDAKSRAVAKEKAVEIVPERDQKLSAMAPVLNFAGHLPDELVGHSIKSGDVNGDGCDDVIVGAPGYSSPSDGSLYHRGAVFMFFGCSNTTQNGKLKADVAWIGHEAADYGHFGFAVEVLDFNRDGKVDVVISSPRTSADKLQYEGRVRIFFGPVEPTKGEVLAPKASVTLLPSKPANFSNFGASLFVVDVTQDGHDDLVVGSPQAPSLLAGKAGQSIGEPYWFPWQNGRVAAYGSRQEPSSSPLWELDGSTRYEWFGKSLAVSQVGHKALLVVGAPLFNRDVNVSQPHRSGEHGRLYVYELQPLGGPKFLFFVVGDDSYAKLGYSVASARAAGICSSVEEDVLVVSMPTLESPALHEWDSNHVQAGTVLTVTARDLLSLGNSRQGSRISVNVSSLKTCSVFKSEQGYSRLGWAAGFASAHGKVYLWFTEPYRDTLDGGVDSGTFYMFVNGSVPTGVVDSVWDKSTVAANSHRHASLYGHAGLEVLDFNADGQFDVLWGGPRDRFFFESGLPKVNVGSIAILLNAGD